MTRKGAGARVAATPDAQACESPGGWENQTKVPANHSRRLTGRPSAADRERAAEALRRAYAEERLSVETLSTRLDFVYAARTRMELDRLLTDVAPAKAFKTLILMPVAWLSDWSQALAAAWRAPRTARLTLPRRDYLVIGRSRRSNFVLPDPTVSNHHAVLNYAGGTWTLSDSSSTNGTFVNGWRVIDPVVVRPGDEVIFGMSRFILAPPPDLQAS
jgi:hypothetical protein